MGAGATSTRTGAPARSEHGDDDRLRVLVLAEACNPTWASVPLVGFNQARALSRHPELDVVVATQVRNRAAIEADPRSSELDVVFVDTEWVARPFHAVAALLRRNDQIGFSIATAAQTPSYLAFEAQVALRFRDRLDSFDLVHRITPVSPAQPSLLCRHSPVPVVVGPLNGGLPFPAEFADMAQRENDGLLRLRALHKLVPYSRSTFTRAAGVVVASSHTATETAHLRRGPTLQVSENGIDPEIFPLAETWTPPGPGPFRFVTAGRLVPAKGFDMIVDALAGSDVLAGAELHIVGEGIERAALEAQIERLGLRDRVHLHGWTDQRDMAELYRSCHAFVFSSVKEFGGGVILEAMSASLPCIVVDYGGPADLVDETSGLEVPMSPRPQLVAGLRRAMEALATDEELATRLAAGARRTAREHTWDAKADRYVAFYREVLATRRTLARGAE